MRYKLGCFAKHPELAPRLRKRRRTEHERQRPRKSRSVTFRALRMFIRELEYGEES